MLSKKSSVLLVVVVIATLLLSACAQPTPEVIEKEVTTEVEKVVTEVVEKEVTKEVEKVVYVTPTPKPVPDEPVHGGTLRITYYQPWGSLDVQAKSTGSQEQMIATQVWDRLVRWDPEHNVAPELAESWDISDDNMTYTFYLREGVVFHNGEEVTAEDVVYSLERMSDPEISTWADLLNVLDTVEAVDDYTVQVTTSEVYAPFLDMLAYYNAVIYPTGHVPSAEDGYIGSGPFMIESTVFQEEVVLVRNPDYWGAGEEDLPYLDEVVINRISDPMARTGSLLSGQSHLVYSVADASRDALDENPDFTFFPGWVHHKGIALSTYNVEAFADPVVREAVSVAIDRQALVDVVLEGVGFPILGDPQPPHMWSYYDKQFLPSEGDLDQAQALLEEAGYGDGFSFSLGTYGEWAADVKAAELIQARLAEIGVEVEIEFIDPGIWVDKVYNGEIEAVFQGLGYRTPDLDFRQSVHPTQAVVKNIWENDTIAQLIDDAATTMDREERKEIYHELVEALYAHGEDTYTVYLELWRSPLDICLSTARVQGFYADGSGALSSLEQMWLVD